MGISRRGFVKMAGVLSLSSKADAIKSPLYGWRHDRSRYALIGDFSSSPGVNLYRVDHRVDKCNWTLIQRVESEAPIAIVVHPSGRSIYVLNGVASYKGLPRGSVESYGFDRQLGRLALLGREPLALSAIMPRSMAISPDGRTLVVAVDGGGAHNVLPIDEDGRVGRVSGIFKDTGCGPVAGYQGSARPQVVCFDSSGERFFSSDLGCDRLSVYAVGDGLRVEARHPVAAGSGPRHLQYDPHRGLIFVAHALEPGVSTFAYDEEAGVMSRIKTESAARAKDGLLLHPSGAYLVAADEGLFTLWRVDAGECRLVQTDSRIIQARMQSDAVQGLTFTDGGRSLTALTSEGAIGFEMDDFAGRLGRSELVARCLDARSVVCL